MFNNAEKKYIISLARKAISRYFKIKKNLIIEEVELPSKKLKENLACFVTLEKEGILRGCVGNLKTNDPLYKGIITNAVRAGFFDDRFEPLQESELKSIKIEVSVLSKPQAVNYRNSHNLLQQFRLGDDGLTIEYGGNGATYLPQVGDDFEIKEDFLSSLCKKAGFEPRFWQSGKLKVEKYQAEIVQEYLSE